MLSRYTIRHRFSPKLINGIMSTPIPSSIPSSNLFHTSSVNNDLGFGTGLALGLLNGYLQGKDRGEWHGRREMAKELSVLIPDQKSLINEHLQKLEIEQARIDKNALIITLIIIVCVVEIGRA